MTDAEVPGTLIFIPEAQPGQPAPVPQNKELRLQAVADQPGEYRADMIVPAAGTYSYSTARDPNVAVKFSVAEPRVETADIAMNEKLLRAMATASGGQFLREEDLNGLPELVKSKSANSVKFKKIPLAFAPLILALMILAGCSEWLWRRRAGT